MAADQSLKEQWTHHSRKSHIEGGRLTSLQAHLVATLGEFVGTFFFLWMSYSINLMAVNQASSKAALGGNSSETVVFVSLGYGFALLVNAWAFFRISGGLFNPAVALGLGITGQLPWIRTVLFIPTELVASMVAGGLVNAMFPGPIADANTTLAPGTSTAQGLFIEMFLTAQLVFVIIMLAGEKSKVTFLAPVGIGLALFVSELSGVYFTGGSLNPARSFGCAVAARSFPGYHWIYWLGPILGAGLAASYYHVVKWARYEEVNAGQDSAGTDAVQGEV